MSIFSKDALADKSIIVTGASGGIGKAVVHTLVNMGANVTASGRYGQTGLSTRNRNWFYSICPG